MLVFRLIFAIDARYVIIFWLKNPAVINDDFWGLFLTMWVTLASVFIDFSRYFLPGKHAFAYYVCTGVDLAVDAGLPNKPTSFLEIATIVFNVILIARIVAHNKSSFSTLFYTYINIFVARNFRILHPIIKDAESGQIWHFVTMPGAEHCNINYNAGCSGTPYCYMYFQAILYILSLVHWVR
jgi:hypothetical protein